MIKYNPNALYSFTDYIPIRKEIRYERRHYKRGNTKVDYFYGELTDIKGIVVIPRDMVIIDLKTNTKCSGYLGIIKDGDYYDREGRKIIFTDIHQVWSNRAFAKVKII